VEPGTVLDVGSAAGFWLAGLADCGFAVRGIEPNATMAEHARERLGLRVDTGSIEELAGTERFDLVTMIQVVAHFVDVRAAVESAVARIRPGGHLLVETWNHESLTARCFGRHWHEYSPPSVLHYFSRRGFAAFAERLGLREVARGRPRKRIRGDHAKALLRHAAGGSGPGRILARLAGVVPDRLSLPYPADDLFWMLLSRADRGGGGA
jgi:SAM-dependent methyltransferase